MLRVACGVDVHWDGFVATILTSKDCETKRFGKDLKDIEAFKAWLRKNGCRAVVMESTGVGQLNNCFGLFGCFQFLVFSER